MLNGRDRVRAAGQSGSARSEFIRLVRRLVKECRDGRAASACMADISAALTRLDARSPRRQK